jgi:hypothetical protein
MNDRSTHMAVIGAGPVGSGQWAVSSDQVTPKALNLT